MVVADSGGTSLRFARGSGGFALMGSGSRGSYLLELLLGPSVC